MLTPIAFGILLLASGVEEDPRFLQALERFEAMDSRGALDVLRALDEDEELSASDRATVLLWIGVNQCELGRCDEDELIAVEDALHRWSGVGVRR